jgi:hypothetical protein
MGMSDAEYKRVVARLKGNREQDDAMEEIVQLAARVRRDSFESALGTLRVNIVFAQCSKTIEDRRAALLARAQQLRPGQVTPRQHECVLALERQFVRDRDRQTESDVARALDELEAEISTAEQESPA